MFSLLTMGVLGIAFLSVVGVLLAAVGIVGWALLWPFRLLGLAIKGMVVLLALPFMLLFAILGVVFGGIGLLAFMVPMMPFLLLALGAIWLVRRNRPRPFGIDPAQAVPPTGH